MAYTEFSVYLDQREPVISSMVSRSSQSYLLVRLTLSFFLLFFFFFFFFFF